MAANTQPSSVSFLYRIRQLRYNPESRRIRWDRWWWPPGDSTDFWIQEGSPSIMCKWVDGNHSLLQGVDPNGLELLEVASVFWHDDLHKFISVEFDATEHSVQQDDWCMVEFNNTGYPVSRLQSPGQHQRMCTPADQTCVGELIPENYNYDSTGSNEVFMREELGGGNPPSGGLSGPLTLITALAAFSGPEEYVWHVLSTSFKRGFWRSHGLPHSRKQLIAQMSS